MIFPCYFSLSTNIEDHVSVLLISVRVLSKLYSTVYQSTVTSFQSAAVNGVTPVSPKALQIFKVYEAV